MPDQRPARFWYALAAAFLSSILAAVIAVVLSAQSQHAMEKRLDAQRARLAEQQQTLETQQRQLSEQSRVAGLALCFLAAEVTPDDGPEAVALAKKIRDTYGC